MKLSFTKKFLANVLREANFVIGKGDINPIYQYIKLETDEIECKITSLNDDGETFIRRLNIMEYDDLTIEETGKICIDAKKLYQIVQKAPKDITIATKDEHIEIKSGRSRFKLNPVDPEQFPNVHWNEKEGIKLDQSIVKAMINVAFACAKKGSARPILEGINIEFTDDRITVVATDSLRLTRHQLNNHGTQYEGNITIPQQAIKMLKRIITGNDTVEMLPSANICIFQVGDRQYHTRLLSGSYPDTNRLIQLDRKKTTVKTNRERLLETLERGKVMNTDAKMRFRINGKKIQSVNQEDEIGEFSEEFEVQEKEGDDIDISFDVNFLTDALESMNTEYVTLKFDGELKPFYVTRSSSELDQIQLISPVRRY